MEILFGHVQTKVNLNFYYDTRNTRPVQLSRISTATFSREKRHKHCHFTFLGKTFLFASELKKSQLLRLFAEKKHSTNENRL